MQGVVELFYTSMLAEWSPNYLGRLLLGNLTISSF